MMKGFGINIEKAQSTIYLSPQKEDFYFQETSSSVTIPSDFSSAAFFIVLGLISKQTPPLVLHDIGLNPTRAALLDILMEATLPGSMTVFNKKTSLGESIGSIEVSYSSIDNTKLTQSLTKKNLSFLIDEVPILAIAAHFGQGTLTISNAEELRFKESDRISSTVDMINRLGGKAKETKNGLIIEGMMGAIRKDISFNTYNDHRIAMSGLIAGKATGSSVKASDTACIATSFPNFFDILDSIPDIN
jgi:3-phosphoshikimate 1-carboxyvinyltransferase